jgi:hypothetical protein
MIAIRRALFRAVPALVLSVMALLGGLAPSSAMAAPRVQQCDPENIYVQGATFDAVYSQWNFKVIGVGLSKYLGIDYGTVNITGHSNLGGYKDFGVFNASGNAGIRTGILTILGRGNEPVDVSWGLFRANNLVCTGGFTINGEASPHRPANAGQLVGR